MNGLGSCCTVVGEEEHGGMEVMVVDTHTSILRDSSEDDDDSLASNESHSPTMTSQLTEPSTEESLAEAPPSVTIVIDDNSFLLVDEEKPKGSRSFSPSYWRFALLILMVALLVKGFKLGLQRCDRAASIVGQRQGVPDHLLAVSLLA